MTGRLRSHYGDTPLHLVAHLASFAIAGWAILYLFDVRPHLYVLGWFVGAVLLHDFLLLPFYAILDRLGAVRLGGAVNYVRVPLGLSGLLLLVYFPVILDEGEAAYGRVSGLSYDGYAGRWLLFSAALFLGSAILYGVRARGRRSAGSSS
jgi:hypothetical protein